MRWQHRIFKPIILQVFLAANRMLRFVMSKKRDPERVNRFALAFKTTVSTVEYGSNHNRSFVELT